MITTNKIIDYLKTWEDACRLLSIKPESILVDGLTKSEIAGRKLKLIIKVLNEDWIPKLDGKEYMYTIRWKKNKDGSFSYYGCNGWTSDSNGAVGLGFKNEILAKYCAEQFIDLWNEYLRYDTNEFLLMIK